MAKKVVDISSYRKGVLQAQDQEQVIAIAKDFELATLNMVRTFASKYPDYPDTFFAFLATQYLLEIASNGAKKGHNGSLRLLSHAMSFLENFENHLKSKGTTVRQLERFTRNKNSQEPHTIH